MDFDDDTSELLGYGDTWFGQMALVRRTVTSRRKFTPVAVPPVLRSRGGVPVAPEPFIDGSTEAKKRANTEKVRARYQSDPEFRERRKAASRKYGQTDKHRAHRRDRYFFDVEFRQRRKAIVAQSRKKNIEKIRAAANKRLAERRATDPDYRARINAQNAERQKRKWREDPEFRERMKQKFRDARRKAKEQS